MNLDNSPVYDIETFPNVFTLHMEMLNDSTSAVWEISDYRDDRRELFTWLDWLMRTQTPTIGFNNVHFDYTVIHWMMQNPNCTVEQIYEKAMSIIQTNDRFAHTIWASDRYIPQVDLFKINHFDNKAKTTSLKALQINMRLPYVVDMPVELGKHLHPHEINDMLVPYGNWDVSSTKQFAHYNKTALDFRLALVEQFGPDVLNWNDTKIGAKILEQRLGDELMYDRSSGRRIMRQTPRDYIALNEIIFPFIQFGNPEFNRVLEYMQAQVLRPAEFEHDDGSNKIVTKGVFAGLKANVDGIDFKFGTGGIHGSVERQRIVATDEWFIRDIDVASLYPNIGIQHGLAPEHLGEAFVREYSNLPKERKEWQIKKGKKCVEANSLKLASNGTYGNTNSPYSPFYDPKYTMTITINGQLMLAMLVEWLLTIPTVKIIQANTDGITYVIHREHLEHAKKIEKHWEQITRLTLEDADYEKMFIRDVNSYVGIYKDGSMKLKGAYWTPDPFNYAQSISEAQPPAWHKDLSNCVSIRAAVAAMVHNVPPETFIAMHNNPYDFMLRIKVGRQDTLTLDGQPIQKTSRYYVAKQGGNMVKISPPAKGAQIGSYKRANGVSDMLWHSVNAELEATGRVGQWDERIHTKNKSKHENRETNIEAGYKVAICNDVNDFRFDNVNYEWYVQEARKLII